MNRKEHTQKKYFVDITHLLCFDEGQKNCNVKQIRDTIVRIAQHKHICVIMISKKKPSVVFFLKVPSDFFYQIIFTLS